MIISTELGSIKHSLRQNLTQTIIILKIYLLAEKFKIFVFAQYLMNIVWFLMDFGKKTYREQEKKLIIFFTQGKTVDELYNDFFFA